MTTQIYSLQGGEFRLAALGTIKSARNIKRYAQEHADCLNSPVKVFDDKWNLLATAEPTVDEQRAEDEFGYQESISL